MATTKPRRKMVSKKAAAPKKSRIKGGEVGSIKTLKKNLKRGSGGQYLKRIPEDGLAVRFMDEPDAWIEYFEHYDEARKDDRMFPCVEGDCPGCEAGLRKPSKRYLVNVVDTENNQVLPLVLPTTAASSLVKKYELFQTLLDRDYILTREGTGLETEYDVTPEAPSKMNLSRFEPLNLLDMLEQLADNASNSDEDDDEDEDFEDEDLTDDEDEDDDEDEAPWERRRSRDSGLKKKPPMKKKRKRL